MSEQYNKYRWLELAFSEQIDRINEIYYFDRKDNEFFSVFITDFFLTDPSSTESYSENPYSSIELNILTERIKRLELNDELILSIPRLTVDERKEMMQEFIANRPSLNDNVELQSVIEAENGRTNLDFNNVLLSNDQEEWEQFKSKFIEQKIDTFCNLQNIDFDTTSLWTDKKMTFVSLGLGQNVIEQKSEQRKPWWKFW